MCIGVMMQREIHPHQNEHNEKVLFCLRIGQDTENHDGWRGNQETHKQWIVVEVYVQR